VMLIITLSSIGLPGMNGFIGEFLIMLGAFKWDPRFVVVAALGVILSAVYMLWMFQRVFYGKVTNDHNQGLPDLSFREWAILGPLAAAAIGMGVVPNVFLKPMEPAVQRIVDRVQSRQPMQTAEQANRPTRLRQGYGGQAGQLANEVLAPRLGEGASK
jgi:NADH-quinone oxidoreductase subunit M